MVLFASTQSLAGKNTCICQYQSGSYEWCESTIVNGDDGSSYCSSSTTKYWEDYRLLLVLANGRSYLMGDDFKTREDCYAEMAKLLECK
jgi:hypothetical protein